MSTHRGLRGMYKKIALATDGSEHSKRAAENAVNIAKCSPNSKIDIIYVVNPDKVKSEVLSNWNAGDMSDKRKIHLKEVERIAIDSGVAYEIVFLHGEPGPVMLTM